MYYLHNKSKASCVIPVVFLHLLNLGFLNVENIWLQIPTSMISIKSLTHKPKRRNEC